MNGRFWWKVPLAYCALGAAVGYAAGLMLGSLSDTIKIPVAVRELRERKADIDEILARCEEMREHSKTAVMARAEPAARQTG